MHLSLQAGNLTFEHQNKDLATSVRQGCVGLSWQVCNLMQSLLILAGVYQEPPLDPETLISSAMTLAEAQRKSKEIADDVLIKAMKVSLINLLVVIVSSV